MDSRAGKNIEPHMGKWHPATSAAGQGKTEKNSKKREYAKRSAEISEISVAGGALVKAIMVMPRFCSA